MQFQIQNYLFSENFYTKLLQICIYIAHYGVPKASKFYVVCTVAHKGQCNKILFAANNKYLL